MRRRRDAAAWDLLSTITPHMPPCACRTMGTQARGERAPELLRDARPIRAGDMWGYLVNRRRIHVYSARGHISVVVADCAHIARKGYVSTRPFCGRASPDGQDMGAAEDDRGKKKMMQNPGGRCRPDVWEGACAPHREEFIRRKRQIQCIGRALELSIFGGEAVPGDWRVALFGNTRDWRYQVSAMKPCDRSS